MRRYANAGDYQPIAGCHCLNLVTAVIDFYKRQPPPKRLKTIWLNQKHWYLFVEDLKRLEDLNEGFTVNADQGVPIENSDVTVKRGSMFQLKEIKYEFYTPG